MSLPQASAAPCREVSLEPPAPLVGKECPGGTTSCLSIVGHFSATPTLVSHHSNYRGICSPTTGNLTVMHKGRRFLACKNQHMDLGRTNSYLQCPSSNPNQMFCSSAESSQRCTLARELSRLQNCLIQILKQGVLSILEPNFPTPRQEAESQPHPLWRMSCDPI